MQQGQHDAKIRELAKKTGEKLPDKIENRPQILHGLEVYWRAFWDCTRDRAVGMGEGPLPWSSIDRWARRYGYEDEEFDRLLYILMKMDAAYMDIRSQQMDKKMKKGRSKHNSGGAIRTRQKR